MKWVLSDMRAQYEAAVQEEEKGTDFWHHMSAYQGLDAVTLAYKASARALMARVGWNPFDKLTHVKASMKLFREAIQIDPQHLEVRFLRFAIQHHLPSIIDESENLEEDKAVMMTQFPNYPHAQLSRTHAEAFLRFFKESGRFTTEEITRLEQDLASS
ncbi:MAG: hypothetical protein AAFR61_26985 [Bacteroidota bacterium]